MPSSSSPVSNSIPMADWDGPNDPHKPSNWSFARKWTVVLTTSSLGFIVSLASSSFISTVEGYSAEFHVSQTTMLLGISLYVVGMGLGPLVWGPASEHFGRTRPLWTGMALFCLCCALLGFIRNLAAVLLLRLLAGIFGSAGLGIIAGMYVDFLGPIERGVATGIQSAATFCGPALGPIVGSLLAQYASWKWVAWTLLIVGAVLSLLCFLCTPETSGKILLQRKAQQLQLGTTIISKDAEKADSSVESFATGSQSSAEQTQTPVVKPGLWKEFVVVYLTKPVRMFVTEPILMIFTVYMALAYGILYLAFVLYPVAFSKERGWSTVDAALPFLSILVGFIVACLIISGHSVYFVGKKAQAGISLTPEHRLPPIIIGSILLPIGLFWFAFTSKASIPWPVSVVAGSFIGCGILLVTMSSILYLVEVYLLHINSAMAISNLIRCATAAFFPQAGAKMLARLSVMQATSILGGACVLMAVFPLIMWRYGATVRGWSRFTV